MLKLLSFLLF